MTVSKKTSRKRIAPGSSRVTLEGDLTLARAAALRSSLLGALDRGGRLELGFGPVSRVDVSFLQLLCALHRETLERGVPFDLSWSDLPDEVREMACVGGVKRHLGCFPGCLWCE